MSTPPSNASATPTAAKAQRAAPDGGEAPNVTEGNESPKWICIGHKRQYKTRKHIKLQNRHISIIPLQNTPSSDAMYHAIDSICYHAGGPLTDGAIRQVAGRTCLQCPWHSYLIDLQSGEGLYMDLDRKYRSKGARQRVHEVEVREQHVWVRLRVEGDLPSDEYAFGPKFGAGDDKELPTFPDW